MKSLIHGARTLAGLLTLAAVVLLGVGCETAPPVYSFEDPAPAGTTNARPTAVPGAPAAPQVSSTQPAPTPTGPSQSPDLLHPGNKLTITFSGTPGPLLPHEEKIREDGTITPPLLGRPVQAAGRTVGQLQDDLQKAYVPAFYKSLTVTVTTEERFFYVSGEVKTPGQRLYLSQMTVLRAIQAAGDFTDYADRSRVDIIRANGKTERVNCKKALKDPRLDKPIYPDDTVRVRRKYL